MVLVQCVLEGGTAAGARGLLTWAGTNSGTAHEVSVLITELLTALLLDAPEDNTNGAENNGTTDTNNNTDDDLLVRG